MLTKYAADPALQYTEDLPHITDALWAAGRALTFPRAVSAKHLVQRQIRDGAPKTGILGLLLFQPLELIPAHHTAFLTLSIVGLNRHTDLTNRLLNRFPLPLQHFKLSQFQHDILGLLSLASHLVVLLNTG